MGQPRPGGPFPPWVQGSAKTTTPLGRDSRTLKWGLRHRLSINHSGDSQRADWPQRPAQRLEASLADKQLIGDA